MRALLWVLAALCAVISLWVLESARSGVDITELRFGQTPVTRYAGQEAGPVVVMAHGFAGSRQMMQGFALVLAQAGYTVFAFDFEGHGAHPEPMSGDVTALDGTTRRLVAQTRAVIDEIGQTDAPIAVLGHSMATDVLVRVSAEDPRIGPVVLLSAFSRAITPAHPPALLLIKGAWEPGLTDFARDAVQMVDEAAKLGQPVTADGVTRQALLAPAAEHVSILQSRAARAATLDWLNTQYGRSTDAHVPPTGWALIGLLAAITVLAAPLSRLAPARPVRADPLSWRAWAGVAVLPAIVAPALAARVDVQALPVLVADYLAVHLAVFGATQLAVLAWAGHRVARPEWIGASMLVLWGLGAFGLALHRYGANFMPTDTRLVLIGALALGAVPFMLADAMTYLRAPWWQKLAGRALFLTSLAVAVAIDFEALFFLIMIAPVIVLFLITFGSMGRAFALRSGPATSGVALGLVLAWALGVSFPLFAS